MEFEEPGKQHGGDIGHAHRQAGMAGIGLFHRVHREDTDGIDADPGVECQAGRRARCGGASGFHRQGVLLSSGAVAGATTCRGRKDNRRGIFSEGEVYRQV